MNLTNLHTLIERYEENLSVTMGAKCHEQLKWEAVKIFRDAWFAPDAMDLPFPTLFKRARKGCGLLIDNSRMSATSGVVKMAEQEPDQVRELFLSLQKASTEPDLTARRDHMTDFGDQIETLRQKYFPRNWKYKHTFHDVSCYMAFFAPEQNYIYRSTDAKLMAKYIGFDKPLGSSWHIDLDAYYEMCDTIVDALKGHPSLLEKHQALLNDKCYKDESLHLMAFDLMYCCQCYHYYHGLDAVTPTVSTARSHTKKSEKAKQLVDDKRKKLEEELENLTEQLAEAESRLDGLEMVSLEGIVVSTRDYGDGLIIKHEGNNKITVRFETMDKAFVIHRNIPMRPSFEDDQEIVDLLSDREDLSKKINRLSKQVKQAKSRLEAL